MGGPRDSSLTRVQPAFGQLGEINGPWVDLLCSLGSRAAEVNPTRDQRWSGDLLLPPQFEHPCLAPLDYLEYLVTHARDSELIAHEKVVNYKDETRRKREALFSGDSTVTQEALQLLRQPKGRKTGGGKWHVLEGTSKIDCALFLENVTVFIEGKRTEPHLTDSTQWHRQRNQVVRNLDCLRMEPDRADDWFVMLVVEENTTAADEAVDLDDDVETFAASLPHLSAVEVTEARQHYLGYTTWQSIRRTFLLDRYPDEVDSEGKKKRRSRKCPQCGTTGLPIFYGLPPYYPVGVADERGLLVLGGDVI